MSTVAIVGQTYHFGIGLFDYANTKILKTNPTIAIGDFKRSINGGAIGDMDNTPVVVPAGGMRVEMVLSIAETTAAGAGGHICIFAQDALGTEWVSLPMLVFVHAADLAEEGDAMTLTAAYDDAKNAAQPGEAMSLTGAADTAIATAVWNFATRTLTTPAGTLPGSTNTALVLYKWSNNSATISTITVSAARTALYLTIKTSLDDADADSRVQIMEGANGLTILNGAVSTPAWGSLTVAGTLDSVTVTLLDHAAGQLAAGEYVWDLKQVLIAGAAAPLASGTCTVYRVATWTV